MDPYDRTTPPRPAPALRLFSPLRPFRRALWWFVTHRPSDMGGASGDDESSMVGAIALVLWVLLIAGCVGMVIVAALRLSVLEAVVCVGLCELGALVLFMVQGYLHAAMGLDDPEVREAWEARLTR